LKILKASNFKATFLLLLMMSVFLIQCVHRDSNFDNQNKSSIDQSREPTASKYKLLPEPRYQTCESDKKNYLEDQIQQLSQNLFINHDDDWDKKIPIQCIYFAQFNFKGSFATCESEYSKPKIGALKPCLTENYTRLVYNAYHDVKDCFGLDPKSSFLQIMIESGFHINAINKSGFDAGASQFTKNGIKHVMPLIQKTRQILLESSKPSCSRIASSIGQLSPDAAEIKHRCSMIALPKNPYRSFLMHYLHEVKDQLYLKSQLAIRFPQLKVILSDQQIEELMYFTYNRGVEGTLRLIKGYLYNRKVMGAEVKSEDFILWQNLADIRAFLKKNPDVKRNINRYKFKKLTFAEYALIQNQTYMANMTEARDLVRSYYGNSCSY